MEHHGYEDKASQLYEKAMEDVHNRVDIAKNSLEDISIIVDSLERTLSDEQYESIESLISKAIIALCGI